MLYGIDISNWQAGLVLPESLDFAIMKATGGTGYVDPCCDDWISDCKRKGILFGFYHFACDGYNPDPEKEALYFYRNTAQYVHHGIPILDIEDDRIDDWGNYSQRFIDKYHACTGVWPIVYTSASCLPRFYGYPIVELCGLWIAGYPDMRRRDFNSIPVFPYTVQPWDFASIWQYTSNGKLDWYDGELDLNVAYMDRTAWMKYANPNGNISDTQEMQTPIENDSSRHWSFENGKIKVDVELK